MKQKLFFIIVMSSMIFSSCGKTGTPVEQDTVPTAEQTTLTAELPTEIPVTATSEPTSTPSFTATPDLRMAPEDWKKWPVIPTYVSGTVIDIFNHGQQMGRNPNAFSKIGDCQNVKEAFMGFFDRQNVFLSENQQSLQETLDNFHGYFNRDGYAVEGGLNAPSSLNPLMSDPAACQPDENPLMCEIRNNNPAYAFVSFELWYKGRSAENYETYLRQVLDYLISQGVVPILITKADNTEGDYSINYTIARLAYEYDLPMVNWWYTAQNLSNNGMDPERNDGFHISPTAWTERSYDALETLDLIWKTVRGIPQ
ncbi:MAG: hypothetical protein GYA52_01385 [Chloroflexi bacterium]|nr:hypothetical protein [Chloroflexota bacterium]